jgi:hypothetical protein
MMGIATLNPSYGLAFSLFANRIRIRLDAVAQGENFVDV